MQAGGGYNAAGDVMDAAKGQTHALSKTFLVRRRAVDMLQHAVSDSARILVLSSARLVH